MMHDVEAFLRDKLRSCKHDFCKFLKLQCHSMHNCQIVTSQIDLPFLNGVVKGLPDVESLELQVKEIVNFFEAAKTPFSWWQDRSIASQGLEQELEKHGLKNLGIFPGMAISVDDIQIPEKPDGLVLKVVQDTKQLAIWSETIIKVHDLAFDYAQKYVDLFANVLSSGAFVHLLANRGSKTMGVASILLGDGSASIHNMAVLEEARGYGVGSQLLFELLQIAKLKKYPYVVLQSIPKAASFYRKRGFRDLIEFTIYTRGKR